jgi:hypothetical protein
MQRNPYEKMRGVVPLEEVVISDGEGDDDSDHYDPTDFQDEPQENELS